MELREALSALQHHQTFTNWKTKHRSAFFSHAFKMFQDEHKEWQLGFYEKAKKKITTFIITPQSVKMRPEEDAFRKDEGDIKEAKFPNSALTLEDVIVRANLFQQQNYPKDKSVKIISIFQNLPAYGTVWNITYVTQAFNTLNMKIDPISGKILDHAFSSIFSFRQKDAAQS